MGRYARKPLPEAGPKKYDDADNKYVGIAKSAKRKNRINLRAVSEVLAERGYDPTQEIINILETNSLPDEVQVRVWSNLLEYTQPKKKAVEITGKDGGPIRLEAVSDADLLKIAMGKDQVEDVPFVEVDDRPRNAFGQLIGPAGQIVAEEAIKAAVEDDDGDDAGDDLLNLPEALR